nr:hypothetical protein SHINE37_50014 [Rhizobiaceae bacterium]
MARNIFSTGGGWSSLTDAALRILASRPRRHAGRGDRDTNDQGETFAERLRVLADKAGCAWRRLRPMADDWNEALQEKAKVEKEKREEWKKGRHVRLQAARVKGSFGPAERALDPAGRDAGSRGG